MNDDEFIATMIPFDAISIYTAIEIEFLGGYEITICLSEN